MRSYSLSEQLPGQLLLNGYPVVLDRNAPPGQLYFINGRFYLHPETYADVVLSLHNHPRKDHMIPQKYRAYIYRVLSVLAPIAIFYGVISGEEAALFLTALATILGVGLAAANTPTS